MSIVKKQTLPKSQIELTVELSADEFKPYILRGAENVSREVKIEGFRPGKVPYEILKSKIGEMTILEEAARLAINKTIDQAIAENAEAEPVGEPQVNITKLAPDNPLEYKIVLAILPEIKLGDYKNAKVQTKKEEVNEDEVLKTLEFLRESHIKEVIVDGEVKDGDKVIIDIDMFLDKVPFDGGQAKGTAIIIGKNYIIPGFDKKLIGSVSFLR
jgi:trigger factor